MRNRIFKANLKLLKDAVVLYDKHGTNGLIDENRRLSILCIYSDLLLRKSVHDIYSQIQY